MRELALPARTDNPGNLIVSLLGNENAPSVMIHTHMDQLGFVVRKIEANGYVRVERLGGIPERALAAQELLFCVGEGRDVPGIVANKSHHATRPDEKYRVLPVEELYVDTGFSDRESVLASGVNIGTPAVYVPAHTDMGNDRISGTSIDDRAGCAVLIEVARALATGDNLPTIHLVFAVQEEFNLRGAMIAANELKPDIAIQLDLIQACDTPETEARGDALLGGGPGMSLYSFLGRGTLNGTLPHPALVSLFKSAAIAAGCKLQRSAQTGVLTDNSYVQLTGSGVACIDVGFPMRYSHSARELCDVNDLVELCRLLIASMHQIDEKFTLDRDEHIL